jgi:hypothetical protein
MGYKLDIRSKARLAKVSLFGETSVEEQQRWLDALVAHHDWSPGFSVLVDTRGIADLRLPYSHARQIAAHAKRLDELLGAGRHALVGDTDLLYGYCRLTEHLCRPCSGHIATFRDVDEAERWLRAGDGGSRIHSRAQPRKAQHQPEAHRAWVGEE